MTHTPDTIDGSIIVHYDDTPKTVNKGGGGARKHWGPGSKEKAMWEGIYMMLFLQGKLPKKLDWVGVGVVLEYTTPNTKRDPENFRHPVVKPLADALVKAGYIPDDNPDHFEVRDFAISKSKLVGVGPLVKSRINLAIDYRFARTASEPSVLAAPAPSGTGLAGARRGRGAGDDARTRRAPGVDGTARGN